MSVTIPIYANTEGTKVLNDLDIAVSLDDLEIVEMVFFRIDALEPCFYQGKKGTVVYAGSGDFFSPKTVEEIIKLMGFE